MRWLLCFAVAFEAMLYGASLVSPAPEAFSPAGWRETVLVCCSLVIGDHFSERRE